MSSAQVAERDEQPPQFQRAAIIRLEGMVSPMMAAYLNRKLERAKDFGADLVIVEIESPGGYLESSAEMAARLRDLPWATTAAYIPDYALSGAAIVALGCDDILMRPSARIGDAGPIYQDEGGLFRHAPEKIRSDLVRTVRDLAEHHGRPPALAEAMVDMDLVVYHVKNRRTGEETYKSQSELESAPDGDDWQRLNPVLESRAGLFLELSGQRSVELQLAEAVVENREEVLEYYGVEQPPLVLRPTFVDTAVFVLNIPFVTGLLLVIGLIALYFEFAAPGISIGGLLAGLCFALFFWSRFLGGTSGWLEVVLFAAGGIFLAIELFVLPGFGIAGLLGLTLMLVSFVMAGQDFVSPRTTQEMNSLSRSLLVILFSGVVVTVAAVMITRVYGGIPGLKWLVLQPPSREDTTNPSSKDSKTPTEIVVDGEGLVHVGDWGVAATPLRPAGKVWFDENYVDVVSDGGYVEQGGQVRIIRISGNRIVVREIGQTSSAAEESDKTPDS